MLRVPRDAGALLRVSLSGCLLFAHTYPAIHDVPMDDLYLEDALVML